MKNTKNIAKKALKREIKRGLPKDFGSCFNFLTSNFMNIMPSILLKAQIINEVLNRKVV